MAYRIKLIHITSISYQQVSAGSNCVGFQFAVTPNWSSNLVLSYHWPIVFTKILTNTISPYIFVVNSPINIKIKIIEC